MRAAPMAHSRPAAPAYFSDTKYTPKPMPLSVDSTMAFLEAPAPGPLVLAISQMAAAANAKPSSLRNPGAPSVNPETIAGTAAHSRPLTAAAEPM